MNNTTLLNKLLKIEKNNPGITADPDFRNLLAELKQEIYNSNKGFSSSKAKAAKKALSFLKGIKNRPILKYADIQTINGIDYQVFTDSIMIFYLEDHYCLPGREDYEKNENAVFSYPALVKLLPSENDEIAEANADKILSKLKAKMYDDMSMPVEILKSKSFIYNFDARRLKTVIEILGTTDVTIYLQGKDKPALIVENGTNNKAILLPLRKF